MKRRLIVFMAVIFGITSTSFGSEIQCLVSGNPTSTQYVDATVNLKILLVQFTDIQCKKVSWNTAKYTRDDYEDMFGSQDEYVSPSKYTPDGDAVYGSMNDYFRFMSSGNIVIGASLINNLKPGTIYPVWVTLPHSKAYYHSTPYYDQTLITDAVVAATAAGLTIGTLNDFNKLVIIYAGNRYNGGGLNPYANTIGGTTYIMSELENSPMDQEHDNAKFARIATHCHEFVIFPR